MLAEIGASDDKYDNNEESGERDNNENKAKDLLLKGGAASVGLASEICNPAKDSLTGG